VNAAATHNLSCFALRLCELHLRMAQHLGGHKPGRSYLTDGLTSQARAIEGLHEALCLIAGHDPCGLVDDAAQALHDAACAHQAAHDRAVALLACLPRGRLLRRGQYARTLRTLRLCTMEMGEQAVAVHTAAGELVELVDALR
jgi:hypothetical protein